MLLSVCQDGVAVPAHDEVHLPIAEVLSIGFRQTSVDAQAVADVRNLSLMLV